MLSYPQTEDDRRYMLRALQLAARGEGNTSPNPMVGAVVVADGRIIGEGYHRRCGGPHAEVNAINSISDADRRLLPHSTVYVTLEPCSHYGKTPPCAKLLIDSNVKRVVTGCRDPFPKVSGRGIEMLRQAGIEVTEDVLRPQCEELNVKFITAHTRYRPYITLKWARTANGYIGLRDEAGNAAPLQLSNALSRRLVHRERARHDAIMVGMQTVLSDNPRLDTRLWPGRSPRIVLLSNGGMAPAGAEVMRREDTLVCDTATDLDATVSNLYATHGITSLLVEGGAATLQRFIDSGLFDMIRRETSPLTVPGGVAEPILPTGLTLVKTEWVRDNVVEWYRR